MGNIIPHLLINGWSPKGTISLLLFPMFFLNGCGRLESQRKGK